ncbi:MAG: VCBS repeat-containing protein [Flavipsychrobacter sp.]|nr:VCBS repeat-containing protein [Flavipsychrobacter sp.]
MNINKKINCIILVLTLTFIVNRAIAQPVLSAEIPVSYDVSANGAFQYTVPLRIPPGIKDVMPNLAITYNSQSGNGPLGMGWSLTGLSAITRGNSTIYHNGELAAIDFNNDPLFLDGQRLLEDGGFYLTEVKNFATIRHFTSGDYFIVEYPNGMKYEYGKTTGTTGSKMLAQGGSNVLMWAVNRVEDANGNYVDFEYYNDQNTGEYRIEKIKYGLNSNQNITTCIPVTIEFFYGLRSDINATWFAGSEVVSNVLLQDIDIKFSDSSIANKYHFTYNVNLASRLVKIEELTDGSAKMPDVNINWGTTAATANISQISSNGSNKVISSGDYNGDGYSDIVSYITSGSPQLNVLINNKNGGFNAPIPVPLSFTTGINISLANTFNGPSKLTFDYDGDGMDDVLIINQDGNGSTRFFAMYLLRANGIPSQVFDPPTGVYVGQNSQSHNSNFNSLTHFAPGDFDGDGKTEVIITQPYNFHSTGNTVVDYDIYIVGDEYPGASSPWKIDHFSYGHIDAVNVLDYNGDGKSEYMINHIVSGNTPSSMLYELHLNYNASTFKPQLVQTPTTWPIYLMGTSNFPHTYLKNWFGDFNGDGKSDIISWNTNPSYDWVMDYSDGTYNTFTNRPPFAVPQPLLSNLNPLGPGSSDFNYFAADFNGDGLTDFLQLNETSFTQGVGSTSDYKLFLSKGLGFDMRSGNVAIDPDVRYTTLGDFNGDGQVDVLNATHVNAGYLALLTFQEDNRTLMVSSIEHAGKTINVEYNNLPKQPNYVKATVPDYKYMARILPMKVVSMLSDGVSMSNTYTYEGLLLHKYGLGLKGFEKFNTENNAGQKTYSTFHLTSHVPYLAETKFLDAFSGMPYAKKTTYQQIDVDGGAAGMSRIIIPYADRSEDYIASQITENTIVTGSTASSTVFYEFGSIVSNEVRTKDLNNNNNSLITTTYNYGTNWSANKGKPESVIVYSDIDPNGNNSITRTTNYTYNSEGNVTSITTDPGTSNHKILILDYDDFGNVEKTDVAASGIAPFTQSTIEYSADGKFVTKKTDAEGYTQLFDYGSLNTCWGVVLKETNAQGLETEFEYDQINRITKTKDVLRNVSMNTTYGLASATIYTAGLVNPRFEVTTTNTSDLSFSTLISDKYGRTIRSVTSDFNGNPLYEDKTYNSKGLVETSTKPYKSSAGLSKVETSYVYDDYNRLISTSTTQGGPTINTEYNIIAGHLHTTVTNTGTGNARTSVTCGNTLKSITGDNETIAYTYHGNGTEATIKVNNTFTPNGNTVTKSVDAFGRVVSILQPNAGNTSYNYDALNRVKYEYLPSPDPSTALTYEYTYDKIGRIIEKKQLQSPNTIYTYTYFSATHPTTAIRGLLDEESVSTGYSYKYLYNTIGELQTKDELLNGTSYNATRYDYYSNGKLRYYTFYNDIRIEYKYNSYGGLNEAGIVSAPGSIGHIIHPLWYIWGKSPYGQLENAYLFTRQNPFGMPAGTSPQILYDIIRTHSPHGYLTESKVDRILPSLGMLPNIVNKSYAYNYENGNMTTRTDHTKGGGYWEEFSYDIEYDRLTNVRYNANPANPVPDLVMNYTNNGNIIKKSDVSTNYTYPWKYNRYALGTVPDPNSSWPAGFEIPSNKLETDYYPFRKIKKVYEVNKNEVLFTYGAADERVKAEYYDLLPTRTLNKTKLYGENYEKITDKLGNVTELYYIWAGEELIGVIQTQTPSGSTSGPATGNVYYPITDHLGSITHFLDDVGNGGVLVNGIVEERSYDAWGRLRDPLTWIPYSSGNYPTGLITDRGYTGHEHIVLDGWNNNIINMNGRLYDPLIGRMFSPDPFIPDGTNSQDYNKYTYARNNPLKYNDPDGNWVNIAIGAVVGGFTGYQIGKARNATGWGLAFYTVAGAAIGAGTSGIGTAISAAGGGAITVGAASGAVAGAGFSGLRTNWNGEAMLKGAALGGASGAIGGGVGASIGGGWGAIAGGAASSGFQSIVNGGSIGQIGLDMLVGGGLSYGIYHASSYTNWKYRGGNKWGEVNVSYRQYTGMQADYVRSRFYGKEYGGYLNHDGSYERLARSGEYPFKIEGATVRIDADGKYVPIFHTHWAKPGDVYRVSTGTGQITNRGEVIDQTATRYFSPIDFPLDGPSLMLNRYDGAYGSGAYSWVQINPNINRYFPYTYNFW